jgi:hypothetical protein
MTNSETITALINEAWFGGYDAGWGDGQDFANGLAVNAPVHPPSELFERARRELGTEPPVPQPGPWDLTLPIS